MPYHFQRVILVYLQFCLGLSPLEAIVIIKNDEGLWQTNSMHLGLINPESNSVEPTLTNHMAINSSSVIMVVNPQLIVIQRLPFPTPPHTFNSRRMTVIWPWDAMARSKCNLSPKPIAQKTKKIE